MKKKILSIGIVIILIMMLVVLTGCGSNNETEESASSESEISNAAEDSENESDEDEDEIELVTEVGDLTLEFESGLGFSEGLAAVKKNNKYGYIDKDGNVVIDFIYDYAGSFSEGLAAVKKNDKYGYIDTNGNVVIDFQYYAAGPFSEGLAGVESRQYEECKYIDKTGETVIDLTNKYCYGVGEFHNGVAVLETSSGAYTYMNKNGEFLFKTTSEREEALGGLHQAKWFNDISGFSEGLACIYDYSQKEGYIVNTSGETVGEFEDGVVPSTFWPISNGFIVVSKDNKYGFSNSKGEVVIPCEYETVNSFSEKLAVVRLNGKSGYIDEKGNMAIENQYDAAGSFSEGLAPVVKNEKCGYINAEGKVIIGNIK